LTVAWRQTADERQEAERAVAALLQEELTPDRAVEIAVINNRELRAVFENLGVSQSELIAASRLRNPSFGVSTRWPRDRPRGPNVEVSVAADLLDGVLLPVRKKIAREQLSQTEQRVAHAVLSLAAEVKAAAYTVQAQEQLKVHLATIVEVNDTAADLAQRQYDAGNINQLELANQQTVAQEGRLALMRAEAQLRADREHLNRLLGLSGAQIGWRMAAELPALPETDALPENLEDLAVARRLDVAALKSQVKQT
jgi:cobalt-zinc-cadmium efflux system outer membrane protein